MRAPTLLSTMVGGEDRAIEAVVARYQRVAPAITRFARTLAGNDRLRVRLGSQTAASADEIVCDPRVFQAAYRRNAPVTPDEVALASALHEVVHLVATDFEQAPQDMGEEGEPGSDGLLGWLERQGGPVAERLFFTCEDARQELRGLAPYPGARSVLTDMYRASVDEAIATAGGLGQFVVACFLTVGKYTERKDLEHRIHKKAALALNDAGEILQRASQAAEPWKVARCAIELLEICRMHGLLTELAGGATAVQQRKAAHHDAEAAGESLDQVRLPTQVLADAESYDATRQAAEQRAGESNQRSTSEVAGDEATDQLLRISQAPLVYLPNGQGGRLLVTPIPASFARFGDMGRLALMRAANTWSIEQRRVSGELYPLFAANQRRGLRSGYDQGDVSPHAALFIGAGLYQRLYERRTARSRRRYAVSLLVDASASMLQPRSIGEERPRAPWGMAAALLGAWTLAHLCNELQIDFEVALFNRSYAARPADTEWSYTRGRSAAIAGLRQTQGGAADRLSVTVNHYLVKSFESRWRQAEDLLTGLFWVAAEPTAAAGEAKRNPQQSPPVSMFEKAANVDEFNLVTAVERMRRLGSKIRVLVVLADGMTRGSVEALAEVVGNAEREGTTVLGLGIGDDTVAHAYQRHQVVSRPDVLAQAMIEGTRAALRRSLSMWGLDSWWSRPAPTETASA